MKCYKYPFVKKLPDLILILTSIIEGEMNTHILITMVKDIRLICLDICDMYARYGISLIMIYVLCYFILK
jgi:predicted protein tyrosine phosphatase